MDRLICGDVGYGKTEIAMRAAFRAVMGNRQVAMLVPTTILAQQHFRTFSERMADYPVRIEMLSRFLTGSETREVLEGMASGQVDIVIGTHRLLQDDVSFRDLGLVIIDEEQRFGVEHKEKLKQMRATVDVLTLTATPIPRTLHMSLMGLREISALQTPPRERQAIRTRVSTFDPQTVRHAILRELNREGQVFVIHNRVHSIDAFADRLREIVPEAGIAVAHGQMPENRLARTMDLFRDGEVDVLVSTTIVESGLDIPNANTIILNRAELLGLAEMHQLRGRVGRYVRKAYAYFFRPADRPVTPEAQARLDAIRRYSQLGAGFDIALRDLEIRGAGNILGPEQSGHIAAVGYNLYCRLLARAAHRLKGEPLREPPDVTVDIGLEALLPDHYVPTPRQKMEVYRQINRAVDLEEVRAARAAMRDRLGPVPPEARNLLLEAELRILADSAGIASIHLKDGRIHLGVRDAEALRRRFEGAPRRPRMITADLAVLDGRFPEDDAPALAEQLKEMLSTHGGPEESNTSRPRLR
jgi:transcription-repair coupling factor (superfamily II helicase)